MALADAVAAAENVGLKLAEELRPATLRLGDLTLPAAISPFEIENVFVGAGFSPSLRARALVRKEAAPDLSFRSGDELTVVPQRGEPRACRVVSAVELLTGWQLILAAEAEGA